MSLEKIISRKRAYLAGPMEYAENAGIGWRLEYQPLLKELNIDCVIPELEEKLITNQAELNHFKLHNSEKYIQIMRKLIDLDLEFVRSVDYIIVRWEGERMSGTIHEVGKAYELNKPTFLVTSQPFNEIPGWFGACFTEIFSSKEALINRLRELRLTKGE